MKQPKRLLSFIAVVIVILATTAVIALYISKRNNAGTASTSSSPTKVAEDTSHDADKVAFEGDVDAGVKAYDEAIAKETDGHAQFTLYSRKATLLYNNQRLEPALEAAKKAFELMQSANSAAFIGQIAHEMGNKPLALEYYKKALSLVDKEDPLSEQDTAYYKGIIQELEAK